MSSAPRLLSIILRLIGTSLAFSIDRECSWGRQRSKIHVAVYMDYDSEMVEIILKCHPDKWCGFGFDTQVMSGNPCTIISQSDAPYASEWELGNYKKGTMLTQDTISNISIITDSDWRIVTMRRPITNSLYSFDHSDDSIPIIWAMSETGVTKYGGFHQAWGWNTMQCEDYVSTTSTTTTTATPTTGLTGINPITPDSPELSTTDTVSTSSTDSATTEIMEIPVVDGDDEFVVRKEHEEYSSFLEPVIYSIMAGCIIIVTIVVVVIYGRKYMTEQRKQKEVDLASKSKSKLEADESPETSSKTNESVSGDDGNSETLGSSRSDDIDV